MTDSNPHPSWTPFLGKLGLALLELDGQGNVLMTSSPLEDLLDVSPGSLLGLNFSDLYIAERDRVSWNTLLVRALSGRVGADESHRLTLIDQSGEETTMNWRFDRSGRGPGSSVLIAGQLTERDARSSAHEETQALLRSGVKALLDDSAIAMRAVSSFLALLDREYEGILPPSALRLVRKARTSMKRTQDLRDGISDYIEADAGNFEVVDLEMTLDQAFKSLSQLGCEIHCTPLPSVHGDPNALSRLFSLLFENALRFRREDRPLEVSVSNHSVGNRVYIRIRDNGVGIDPEFCKQAVEVLAQCDTERAGIGMGLAVARRIVQRHGGRLNIYPARTDPDNDGGAEVELDLQIANPPEAEAGSPTLEDGLLRPMEIFAANRSN